MAIQSTATEFVVRGCAGGGVLVGGIGGGRGTAGTAIDQNHVKLLNSDRANRLWPPPRKASMCPVHARVTAHWSGARWRKRTFTYFEPIAAARFPGAASLHLSQPFGLDTRCGSDTRLLANG